MRILFHHSYVADQAQLRASRNSPACHGGDDGLLDLQTTRSLASLERCQHANQLESQHTIGPGVLEASFGSVLGMGADRVGDSETVCKS